MQNSHKGNELIPNLLVEEEIIPSEDELKMGIDLMKKSILSVDDQFQVLREKIAVRDYILLPCHHNSICSKCAPKSGICPFCKGDVTGGKTRVQTIDESDMILAGLKKEETALKRKPGSKLPEKEVRRLKLEEVFMNYDKDNSGYIEKKEIKDFMKVFIYQGLDISEAELTGAIDIIDVNKDGKISPDEFISFVDGLTNKMKILDFTNAINNLIYR